MLNFRKRIDLIQKLRKLTGRKERFDRVINHLDVYEISDFKRIFHIENGKFSSHTLYKLSHHRLQVRIQDFSHRSDSLVGKMIRIISIKAFFLITEIYKIFHRFYKICSIKNICLSGFQRLFEIEFCINLSPCNISNIDSFRKQELPFHIIQS